MVLTSQQLHNSLIYGAYKVIQNKQVLNKINVFPVRDGDTGSNLASMMRNIIQQSEPKKTIKQTLVSVSDAALYGARGNSGIIFAQYLNGLSESVSETETITINEYAIASNKAVKYAYEAIEIPVEGTMITVMKEWGRALCDESETRTTINDIMNAAYKKIEIALERTKEQLQVLKKAGVVDSGAKGFTYFLEGALYYIENGEDNTIKEALDNEMIEDIHVIESEHVHSGEGRYCTECLLEDLRVDRLTLKSRLSEMGYSLVVAGSDSKCRIHVHTDEPADVFDYLLTCGNPVYQKVDDMSTQETMVKNRKYDIALLTDSIADVPKEFLDEYQVQMIHLDIIFRDVTYMDKLTIKPERLLELSEHDSQLPTSSQPSPKQIENMLDYITTYYDSVIVMTVSKALSGTNNVITQAAQNFIKQGKKITVIDTKQNSVAQGLLVRECAQLIDQGMAHDLIVKQVEAQIKNSKILVQVRNLNNMIKSGRLSVRAGKIGRAIGLKPIVTLDEEGQGALDGIALSVKGSHKKLIKAFKSAMKNDALKSYGVVHIDNLEEAKALSQLLTDITGFPPTYITETSSIVAIGAGKGAVAVGYITR